MPRIVVWNVAVDTPGEAERFGSCAAMITSEIAAVNPISTARER